VTEHRARERAPSDRPRRALRFAARRWSRAAFLGLTLLSASAPSPAGERIIRLSVRTEEGCPREAEVLAQVRERVPFRKALAGEVARELEIVLLRGVWAEARLVSPSADGMPGERRIVADTCEDAAAAIALVTALAIEGGDAVDPRDDAARAPSPVPAQALPAPDPPAPRAIPAASDSPGSAAPPDPLTDPALGLGVELAFQGGVAPSPVFVPRAFVEVRLPLRSLPRATLRVGVGRGSSDTVRSDLGTAELTWTAGHVEGCPLRLDVSAGAVSLRPCATFDVGVLEGAGNAPAASRHVTRPWMAPGLAARLDARWNDRLGVSVAGGAHAPLVRDELVIDPSAHIHRAPAVAGWVSGGVVLFFR
jgi:hypothetical protein